MRSSSHARARPSPPHPGGPASKRSVQAAAPAAGVDAPPTPLTRSACPPPLEKCFAFPTGVPSLRSAWTRFSEVQSGPQVHSSHRPLRRIPQTATATALDFAISVQTSTFPTDHRHPCRGGRFWTKRSVVLAVLLVAALASTHGGRRRSAIPTTQPQGTSRRSHVHPDLLTAFRSAHS